MTLDATDISVRFAGLNAVDGVSLTLGEGEILGLVGPNGAGKTTLVNVLSGFQKPASGTVSVLGRQAQGRPADWFSRNGVARTFQAVRLFRGMTVAENVEVSLAALGLGRGDARRQAAALLKRLGLADLAETPGRSLNYGDERRVGIARALALSPRFLLLDEPAAGMNIPEAAALGALVRRIRDEFRCGILLIEHNMRLVMAICERLQVMASGRTIAKGAPAEVAADRAFRSAYLGSGAA
jgi:branched-chain amino acid transport system ATP-binding protein